MGGRGRVDGDVGWVQVVGGFYLGREGGGLRMLSLNTFLGVFTWTSCDGFS